MEPTHDPDLLDAAGLAKYRKTIAAFVLAALTWGTAVVVSEPTHITAPEVVGAIGALATVIGVYAVPNAGVRRG